MGNLHIFQHQRQVTWKGRVGLQYDIRLEELHQDVKASPTTMKIWWIDIVTTVNVLFKKLRRAGVTQDKALKIGTLCYLHTSSDLQLGQACHLVS